MLPKSFKKFILLQDNVLAWMLWHLKNKDKEEEKRKTVKIKQKQKCVTGNFGYAMTVHTSQRMFCDGFGSSMKRLALSMSSI